MAVEFWAPFDNPIISTTLPNPEIANVIQKTDEIKLHKLRYVIPPEPAPTYPTDKYVTYIRGTGEVLLQLTFNRIGFAVEQKLLDFFKIYSSVPLKYVDHNREIWKVIFVTDTLSISEDSRAYPQFDDCTDSSKVHLDHFCSVSFTLKGNKV